MKISSINNCSNIYPHSFKQKEESVYSPLEIYTDQIKKYKRITQKEEQALAQKIQTHGDEAETAKEKLIKSNLMLVVARALSRFKKTQKLDIMDYIQEGNIGLYEAAKRYNGTTKFSTFAVSYIDGYLKTAELTKQRIIRLPKDIEHLIVFIEKKNEELTSNLNREPSLKELSLYAQIPAKRLKQLKQFENSGYSLYTKIAEDDAEYIDIIPDENAENPVENTDKKVIEEYVKKLLGNLSNKQKNILISYYGLFGTPQKNQNEIARIYKVSYQRIQNLIKKSLDKISKNNPSILKDLKKEMKDENFTN